MVKPFFLTLAALLAGAAAPPAVTPSADSSPPAAAPTIPAAAEVLAHVRQALGVDRLSGFGPAFAIREQGADGQATELRFGTQDGALRRGDDFWFDGRNGWQQDGRRNMAVPAPLRQMEKAAWPLWVRGHWWLSPKSGFFTSVDAARTSADAIAIAVRMADGIVGATVFVDRRSWMPIRIVVPYERGPFTEVYGEYRAVNGVRFAHRIESTYRGTALRIVSAVSPLRGERLFARPDPPADHRFDAAKPALLATLPGVPFSPETPGHVYVRAGVDGREGWWHFDSGSDSMIIDEAAANALNLEVIGTHRSMGADGIAREGTWRRAKSFTLGPIRVENMVFRALDLSANNAPPGERRMGTIGYDLLARALVEYGEGGRRVRICDPAAYRLPAGAAWQGLRHIDATPAFPAVADGFVGLFQLDTGSAGTIDFARPFHERNRMLAGRKTRSLDSQGSGGAFAVEVGTLGELRLAGETFHDLEVTFRTGGISREGSAGTIGREILDRFTMVFDYPHQRLAFLPRGSAGTCE